MIQDNETTDSLNTNNDATSLSDTSNKATGNSVNGNDLGNTTFTEEEIEQANKPQPNVILNKTSGDVDSSTTYRDKERVSIRANEAPDSTDTNTGGIVAGGAKGTSQS